MILVIDTSASIAVLATIDGDRRTESFFQARRDGALRPALREVARKHGITKVAIATGPGSFTGLRVGVSFGLGLAMGLRVPIVPLPTLDLQAARSEDPVTAIVDAGRGRYYFQAPGGETKLGDELDVPTSHELVGSLADPRPLLESNHLFRPNHRLLRFVDAAAKLLETAHEVPYRNLEIEYMQSFSPRKV